MQAIVETLFDAVYLISVITIGILMIRTSRGNAQFKLFGMMAVVLGVATRSISFPVRWRCAPQALRTTPSPLALGSGSPRSR